MYKKLKRTWSNSELNYIPDFKREFPELKKVDNQEICDRFIKLKLDFYTEVKKPVNPLTRLTLPFALLLFVLMFLNLPIYFMLTGKWGYSLGKDNRILNWFRVLKIQ